MSTNNIDHTTGDKEDITPPLGPIKIDAVYQLDPSSQFRNWYFLKEGDDYSLFEQGDKPDEKPKLLHSGIKNRQQFDIPAEGPPMWTLTVHFHTDQETQQEKAHGTWKPANGGQEDGGTYTAQSGGSVPTTVSASA
jgi:hypothetical protein